MKPDILTLMLQQNLLLNILEYSEDIGKCAKHLTNELREMVAAKIVCLFEKKETGEFEIAGICPERRYSVFESEIAKDLIRCCGEFSESTLIIPTQGAAGQLLNTLHMNESFVIPLRDKNETLGMILILNLIETTNIEHILEGLKAIAGMLSLILRNSFLYRNMEKLVEQKTHILQENEEKYRLLFDNAGDMILYHDLNGNILDGNKSALERLGYTKEELLSLHILDISALKESAIFEANIDSLKRTDFLSFETVDISKDGTLIPSEIHARLFSVRGEHRIMSISRDMREKKKAEEDRIAREAAEEANKAKSAFISSMSHELRTPLNSVIALSGVLERRLKTKIGEEEYSFVKIIERNGRHLLTLINDILDLSRIEAGREEVFLKNFYANDLVDEIIDILQPQADQKGIFLRRETEKPIPIRCDYSKCVHILQNIVGNAVKFTDSGGVSISTCSENMQLKITVSDSGIGIEKSFLPHIFDEFKQADTSTTRKYGGTGLGLSIALKYTLLLGGTIEVISEKDVGTVFTITLPVKIDTDANSPQCSEITQKEATPLKEKQEKMALFQAKGPARKYKTVLIVEDNYDNLLSLKALLREQCLILEAEDGLKGLQMAKRFLPDLILMDIAMPVMNGIDALKTIKENKNTQHIPVIAVSASAMKNEREHYMRYGFDGYIAKPIDMHILEKTLEDFLP